MSDSPELFAARITVNLCLGIEPGYLTRHGRADTLRWKFTKCLTGEILHPPIEGSAWRTEQDKWTFPLSHVRLQLDYGVLTTGSEGCSAAGSMPLLGFSSFVAAQKSVHPLGSGPIVETQSDCSASVV